MYNVDASAGNITLTLPASVPSIGFAYYIMKVDSSNNTVTVRPQTGERFNYVVNGTFVALSQDDNITVISYGSRGWVLQ